MVDFTEISTKTGDRLSKVFFCDPNSSWQKGCIEKNHEYIRYVLPKGTSFAGISQENANLLASHINSVPMMSLNNQSPYEAALGFLGKRNLDSLGITKTVNRIAGIQNIFQISAERYIYPVPSILHTQISIISV